MRYLAILVTGCLLATPALGQEMDNGGAYGGSAYGPNQGDWEFTLGGGGSSDNDVDVGDFRLDAELGHYLTDDVSVAFRQGISYIDDNAGTDLGGSSRLAVDYHFDLDRFRPFIGVNLGYVYGDNLKDTWAGGPEAGLKWYAKEETFIFARAEYQFLFEDLDNADDNEIDDGQFLYNVGIGFNF